MKSTKLVMIVIFQIIAIIILIVGVSYLINQNNQSTNQITNNNVQETEESTTSKKETSTKDIVEDIQPNIPSYGANTIPFIANDFKYQIRIFRDWTKKEVNSNTIEFLKDGNKVLTITDQQSSLNPSAWYQKNFSTSFSNGTTILFNGLNGFESEYTNSKGTYKDYVVKVGEYIVHFKYTVKEDRVDNTKYKGYVEYLVNSISDVGI